MNISAALMEAITEAAEYRSLPPALVTAIVKVESNFIPTAIRYEPAFYARYIAGKSIKAIQPC